MVSAILLILYISDTELGLKSNLSTFFDNTKLGGEPPPTADCEPIQRGLEQINHWPEKWLMSINTSKCKVIHITSRNSSHTYHTGSEPLQVVREEKDFGVIISSDLKFHRSLQARQVKTQNYDWVSSENTSNTRR